MTTGQDAINIALTKQAGEAAKVVMSNFYLPKIADAARLGISHALKNNLPIERPSGPRENNFGIATIDSEGNMVELLKLFFCKEELDVGPYRVVEALMNSGLVDLSNQIKSGEIVDLTDLLPKDVDRCE